MKKKWIIKAALLAIIAVAAMGAVVMWLWNWLIPALFTGPTISYIQALGLMLLSRILFRGFVGGPGRGCHGGKFGQWKGKWENMSPEERDRMRDLWKKRCGSFNDCTPFKDDEGQKDMKNSSQS